jgi:hypothetical protein
LTLGGVVCSGTFLLVGRLAFVIGILDAMRDVGLTFEILGGVGHRGPELAARQLGVALPKTSRRER